MGFDLEKFDREVAETLFQIHNKPREKKRQERYNRWVSEHLDHLEEMFFISGLEDVAGFNRFCRYVYLNSHHSEVTRQ